MPIALPIAYSEYRKLLDTDSLELSADVCCPRCSSRELPRSETLDEAELVHLRDRRVRGVHLFSRNDPGRARRMRCVWLKASFAAV